MNIAPKSKYLSAQMIKDGYTKGYIESKEIRFEDFKGKDKLVLPVVFNINGTAESVDYVPNKTMHAIITKAYGIDSDDLDGKELTFSITQVHYEGKMVDSIVAIPIDPKQKKLK